MLFPPKTFIHKKFDKLRFVCYNTIVEELYQQGGLFILCASNGLKLVFLNKTPPSPAEAYLFTEERQ